MTTVQKVMRREMTKVSYNERNVNVRGRKETNTENPERKINRQTDRERQAGKYTKR